MEDAKCLGGPEASEKSPRDFRKSLGKYFGRVLESIQKESRRIFGKSPGEYSGKVLERVEEESRTTFGRC